MKRVFQGEDSSIWVIIRQDQNHVWFGMKCSLKEWLTGIFE